jgi:hypothetical protein
MIGPTIKFTAKSLGYMLRNFEADCFPALSITYSIQPSTPKTWLIKYTVDICSPDQAIVVHGTV